MKPPTEIEVQLWLAKQLPEQIFVWDSSNCNTNTPFFQWVDADGTTEYTSRVNPREWDYIVRRVEQKLHTSQHQHYYAHSEKLISGLDYESDSHYGAGWLCEVVVANWTIRTQALRQVLENE